jgi:hypothetical protein
MRRCHGTAENQPFAGMTIPRASSTRHSGKRRNPETHIKTKHLIRSEYRNVIDLLPESLRTAVVLYDMMDCRQQEIAET